MHGIMNAVVNTAPKTHLFQVLGPREQSIAAKGECSMHVLLPDPPEVNAGTEVFSLEKFVFYG